MDNTETGIQTPIPNGTRHYCKLCAAVIDTTPLSVDGEGLDFLCHACVTTAVTAEEDQPPAARTWDYFLVHCESRNIRAHDNQTNLTSHCFICLETKPLAKINPCNHHEACLDCLKTWLSQSATLPNCPHCRSLILKVFDGQLSPGGKYRTLVVLYIHKVQDDD